MGQRIEKRNIFTRKIQYSNFAWDSVRWTKCHSTKENTKCFIEIYSKENLMMYSINTRTRWMQLLAKNKRGDWPIIIIIVKAQERHSLFSLVCCCRCWNLSDVNCMIVCSRIIHVFYWFVVVIFINTTPYTIKSTHRNSRSESLVSKCVYVCVYGKNNKW